jgi:hypothetical protein
MAVEVEVEGKVDGKGRKLKVGVLQRVGMRVVVVGGGVVLRLYNQHVVHVRVRIRTPGCGAGIQQLSQPLCRNKRPSSVFTCALHSGMTLPLVAVF